MHLCYATHSEIQVDSAFCGILRGVVNSDVNVHETNSLFKANFQFVSISKRNVVFYSHISLRESKIRPISFKNFKEISKPKTKRNEFLSQSKKRIIFDTKKAKR
jgi:hypothetical protein